MLARFLIGFGFRPEPKLIS